MKPLRFKPIRKEECYEYHLPLKPYGQFNNSTYPGYLENPDERGFLSWYSKLGLPLNNLVDHDSVMISLFILEFFDARQPASMVMLENPESMRETFGSGEPVRVEWKFGFEFMDYNDETHFSDFGMVSPPEFLVKANYYNKDLSQRYHYLLQLDRGGYLAFTMLFSSDVTSWWFLFVHPAMQKDLETLLSDHSRRPSQSEILGVVYAAVGIQTGTDEGYGDYIVIQSVFDLQEEIAQLFKLLQIKGTLFENSIRDLFPMKDDWQGELYEQAFREFLSPEDEEKMAIRAEAIREKIEAELKGQPAMMNGVQVSQHLVIPAREVWTDSVGGSKQEVLWLVFEEDGDDDRYAIFYDEDTRQFGLGTRRKDGELISLAYYGTFPDTLKGM